MSAPIHCDVLVVGGGINGTGIARDAAGRGLSVVLCEKDDLASHTSSASSKLIHGGLRYLEYFEFDLVRKALLEREVLMRSAPHLISPLGFVMPYVKGLRPAWFLRLGLFFYDHLAKRELLPGSYGVNFKTHEVGQPLKTEFTQGFIYADGWVDDARLVVLNAKGAAEKGAKIFTRTLCSRVHQENGLWHALLTGADGTSTPLTARSLVNATGAWAAQFQQASMPHVEGKTLRLIKGSHIVVKRLFQHPYAYIFQHKDGRIVFVIPYERDFTLIGTTDINYKGDINAVKISQEEIDYLCSLSSEFFKQTIQAEDVVHTYAGVRPLVDDGAADAKAITRDYRLDLEQNGAPQLTVFGGKITTYRKLAEEAVDMLAPTLRNFKKAWTANAVLPGGDLFASHPSNQAVLQFDAYVKAMQKQYDWLPPALVHRYVLAYGSRIKQLLLMCSSIDDMGEEIAAGLYEREVRYLRRHEWARTAQDILWRRSKLGLHLPAGTEALLDAWLAKSTQT